MIYLNLQRRVLSGLAATLLLSLAIGSVGCGEVSDPPLDEPDYTIDVPERFPAMTWPEENPPTEAKIELGRHLFYDTRLSSDLSISCASCHLQEHAFSDTGAVSLGVAGRLGTRNAPSLGNTGFLNSYLWEGGVRTLEQQAIVPITHPDEMNLHTDTAVARIGADPIYRRLFDEAWEGGEITFERVTKSIASFERTIITGNAPFDRWERGDVSALSESQMRGRDLFFSERADCFHCHISYNFTDNLFHNNGLAETSDLGRFAVTQYPLDRGRFKTPTLRNVEVTGPYMHDGRIATLREVVEFYNRGGDGHPQSDPLIKPLGLSEQDIDDIVNFLKALTDEEFLSDPTLANPW